MRLFPTCIYYLSWKRRVVFVSCGEPRESRALNRVGCTPSSPVVLLLPSSVLTQQVPEPGLSLLQELRPGESAQWGCCGQDCRIPHLLKLGVLETARCHQTHRRVNRKNSPWRENVNAQECVCKNKATVSAREGPKIISFYIHIENPKFHYFPSREDLHLRVTVYSIWDQCLC